MTNTAIDHSELVEEYKKYIENSVLNNSFDFDTWCQHQFGESPKDFSIKPEVNFSLVTSEKT